jgi:hypothetical protein
MKGNLSELQRFSGGKEELKRQGGQGSFAVPFVTFNRLSNVFEAWLLECPMPWQQHRLKN